MFHVSLAVGMLAARERALFLKSCVFQPGRLFLELLTFPISYVHSTTSVACPVLARRRGRRGEQ